MVNAQIVAVLALVSLLGGSRAVSAQDLDGTPLASCANYEKNHPLVSDLSWSVNCLLQAIYDGDKRAIVALAPAERCEPKVGCDAEGILDEATSEFIFGFKDTGKVWKDVDAVQTVLRRSSHILVTYSLYLPNEVHVRLIPRPGKDSTHRGPGFNRDYFACFFRYDNDSAIWVVDGSFCTLGTDRYVDESNYEEVIDLTGNDSASLPVMTWKPRALR